METVDIAYVCYQALYVLIAVTTPILIISLIVGLLISLFQALTQIQEATLTFVPKMLVTYGCLILFAPYMVDKLEYLTEILVGKIISG